MKSLFFPLFLLLFFSIGSCSESKNELEDEPRITTETALTRSFEQPENCAYSLSGGLHNEMLDHFLNHFSAKTDWDEATMVDKLDNLVLEKINYINNQLSTQLSTIDHQTLITNLNDNIDAIKDGNITQISEWALNSGISNDELNLLIQVRDIAYNESGLESSLNSIENFEQNLSQSNQMTPLVSESINVLKSSLCYWNSNGSKWSNIDHVNLTPNQAQTRGFWDTVNRMAEGDFWSFAVGTAVLGPAGVIAMGCRGSAVIAIKEVITGECC